MTIFIKKGDTFQVTSNEALDIHKRLPVGTYSVGVAPDGTFFLQIIEQFSIKGKIYGDTLRHADRIINTFMDRTSSTGVLLSGEKGSGKTFLTKYISIEAAEKYSVPTIVINRNLHGETFNTFIQSIDQPTIVLFDEFEKVYHNNKEQEAMLTLLDGVYPSKKLFLLTCNDKWRVNINMKNRPGRIYYLLDFTGLCLEFVREYCMDNLLNKENVSKVCAASVLFPTMNFDMLKAIVEEMNRYNETPFEVLRYLNVRPEFNETCTYNVKLVYRGRNMKTNHGGGGGHPLRNGRFGSGIDDVIQPTWQGNPLKDTIHFQFCVASSSSSNTENEEVEDDNIINGNSLLEQHLLFCGQEDGGEFCDEEEEEEHFRRLTRPPVDNGNGSPPPPRWVVIQFTANELYQVNEDAGSFSFIHSTQPDTRLTLTKIIKKTNLIEYDKIQFDTSSDKVNKVNKNTLQQAPTPAE